MSLNESLVDCARYDEFDEVKQCILEGADINYSDEYGKTALHVSSANGNVEMVEYLLKNGALHRVNESGNTPLHWAALNGHEKVVKMLLAHGANVSSKNNSGETALVLARRGNHDDIGIFLADILVQQENKNVDEKEDEKEEDDSNMDDISIEANTLEIQENVSDEIIEDIIKDKS